MFASNLQIFVGTKAFQESVSTNEINVQKLYDNGSLNKVTTELTFNEKLEGFIKEINTFGDMKVDSTEKHASFSWKSDKSAQIFKSISGPTSIEEISVKLVQKINIGRYCLTGCAISEAGNMLFLQEHKNNLLTYCPNGELHSESFIITGQYGIGYDLEVVDSQLVAVSSGGNPPTKIHFIDMNNAKFNKNFNLHDWCYGLSYHKGLVICCTHANGIKLYDTSQKQNNMCILPNAPKDVNETYVTSNEKSIFHSNWRHNSVVCYDFSGQVQWTYSDSLLKTPYGITLDSYSNIYVVGSDPNNVVVISKDGKQAKQLIGLDGVGLLNPRAVFFHKAKNVLLVATYDGAAFLFDV